MNKFLYAIALGILALTLASCGGSDQPAAEPAQARHSPATDPDGDGPLPARSNEVVADFGKPKGKAAQPCALVTRGQARSILGSDIVAPTEAPQGPTCIYRTRDNKHFITLALQQRDVKDLTAEVGRQKALTIDSRKGFCGTKGRPTVYVPLAGGRVLSVSGPCDVAEAFAGRALQQLGS